MFRHFQPIHKYAALLLLGLLLPTSSRADVDLGFLYDKFPLTLSSGYRTEAIGPILSYEQKETEQTWAFSPLYSCTTDYSLESKEIDFIYPVLTYDRFGKEYRFQIFQLFAFSGGQTQDELQKKRFTLFPFYFQQRAPDTNLNYTAFWPFYGTTKNRLFRDEIKVILFPGYVQSRKKDVVTDNYLFPFFHIRNGNQLHGWQFWPVVGSEHKEPQTFTNSLDEIEVAGGHDKFFAVWPIFSNEHRNIGTTNPEAQLSVLPFYSQLRSPQRDSTSYLWPLGLNIIDDRGRKYREWDFPWPLMVIARGEGKTVTRFWPLFGKAHNQYLQSDFYLWPIYKYNRLQSAPLDRERTRILFFLYSDLTEKHIETGDVRRRTDFWPLFTARRTLDGDKRLQIFAPLEPILPNNQGIERNYSPLWSIWRSEKNAKTGSRSHSAFWNLYRYERTPTYKKQTLLFGLFQHETNPGGQCWRLFYFPIVKNKVTKEKN